MNYKLLTLLGLLAAAPVAAQEVPAFDCLANVCLDTKMSTTPPDSVVVVSDHKWVRSVEVCSGRVVNIEIIAGWQQPGFTWTGVPAGAITRLIEGADGQAAADVLDQVDAAMIKKNWILVDFNKEEAMRIYRKEGVSGIRGLTFKRAQESAPHGWVVNLFSLHPQYSELCAAKHGQGL